MSYDELEEKYYILTQRVADLDRKKTSLEARNNELEAQNIVLENSVSKAEAREASMSKAFQEEALKTINLKVRLDALEKERDELKEIANRPVSEYRVQMVESAMRNDPVILQSYLNWKDQASLVQMPRFSIHTPMELVNAPHKTTNIVLTQTDIMGFMREFDPLYGRYQMHAYAKFGDQVVRYSTQDSLFDMVRREDFAVGLQQMTRGLQELIIDEYSKRDF